MGFDPTLARDLGFNLQTDNTRDEIGEQAIADFKEGYRPQLEATDTPAERAKLIEHHRTDLKAIKADLVDRIKAGKDDVRMKEIDAKLHALRDLGAGE